MRRVLIFLFLAISLLIFRPTPSYAWYNGWHGHSYVGVSIGAWPGYYYGYPYYPYYGDPYYAPAYADPGVVVASSPTYQPVVVNGTTYYVNNGVYYIYTQYGYQAVAAPVSAPTMTAPAAQPAIQPAAQPSAPAAEAPEIQSVSMAQAPVDVGDTYTINIPNDKGGFTAIILKKTDKGWVGPQGELYSEFPKVSQLQTVYGKQ